MALTGVGDEALCPGCLLEGGLDPETTRAAEASRSPNRAPFYRCFGDFELLEEIGRGGMGIVYKARQTSLDRIVAVKMLLFGPLASPELVQRFRTESAAAASLRHPNIVAIYEVGFRDGQHFFAMEHVAGRSLAEICQEGPLHSRRGADYIKTIAEAIHFAHERGILHRDLKPSNVLIDEFDQPKVTDFGLAKRIEKDIELTLSGQVLGSPNYMSPEQAAAKRGLVGKRSDVYSLGAVLYHLFTGRPPFVAQSLTETLHEVASSEPVSPRVLNPSVPLDLATICLKCLAKEPSRRYASAQELADELGRFLRNEPIRARPVTRAERAWRWCRRNPVIAALTTTAALLLLAVAIGSPIAVVLIDRERERAEQVARDRRLDVYVADMKVAHLAIEEGNLGLAVERLRKYLHQEGEEDLRGFEWRYLWNRCQGEELFTLRGHSNRVVSVAFDRTGAWLASASWDGTVRISNVDRRKVVQVVTTADPVLTSVAFSPIGDTLAIGGAIGGRQQVRILDGTGWKTQRILTNSHGPLAFAPDGRTLVTDGPDGMMLWDTASWELVRCLDGLHACRYGGELISNAAFSPDGATFALASYEAPPESNRVIVRVWPFAKLKSAGLDGSPSVLLDSGANTLATVQTLQFSSNGQLLAAGDWAGFIGVWETASGRLLASSNTDAIITGLVFLSDGRTLVSTSSEQDLSLWDYSSRGHLKEFGHVRGHHNEVWAAALSPNGQLLATGGRDAMLKLWDAPSLHAARRIQQADAAAELPMEHHPVWISHDGRQVATIDSAYKTSRVSFLDTVTLATLDSISFEIPLRFIALASDGHRLAAARTNGVVEIWDVANKQRPITSLKGDKDTNSTPWKRTPFGWKPLLNEAWSPDGKQLATFWPRVTIWDVSSGLRRDLPVRGEAIAAGFSPDGTMVAVALGEGVELWDSRSGQRIAMCKGRIHASADSAFMFSNDGRRLLAWGGQDAWVWDVPSGNLRAALPGQTLEFDHAALSSDGRTAVTHRGNSFAFWNLRNGQELFNLRMDAREQGRVLFSADGQTLVLHHAKRPAMVLRAPALSEIDATERVATKAD